MRRENLRPNRSDRHHCEQPKGTADILKILFADIGQRQCFSTSVQQWHARQLLDAGNPLGDSTSGHAQLVGRSFECAIPRRRLEGQKPIALAYALLRAKPQAGQNTH